MLCAVMVIHVYMYSRHHYSLAPSSPFDVARTIFKPHMYMYCTICHMHAQRPRARSRTVYTGQVLPVSMHSLGARL